MKKKGQHYEFPTSSSSIKALSIISTSQVKISQAMKGNLQGERRKVTQKLHQFKMHNTISLNKTHYAED